MAPESKLGSGSVQRRNQLGSFGKGLQVDKIRWEWPILKAEGLQKLMSDEPIAGVLNAVGNAVQCGQRAWDGLVQQGIRSNNLCNMQLPSFFRGKGRQVLQVPQLVEEQESPRAAVSPASISVAKGATNANATLTGVNESQQKEQTESIRFSEEFRVPEMSYGGAVTKEDLGRATWTFLHTLAAQYPEKPTRQQRRDAKELMSIMTRLYPCKLCAEHFKEVLKAYPVKADSGAELAQWMCQVHNVVNRSLGKPHFPCERVDARWGALHCDEAGACDLEGRLSYR